MRRWVLAVLVLAAIVVAMLLVGSPDTGGRVAPRRSPPVAELETEPPVVVADPDEEEPRPEPIRKEKPPLAEGERMFREDGGPLPPAATPEGEMASRVYPIWSNVVQTMSDQANSHPDATGYELQAVQIQREIDKFVRGEGGDMAQIELMQRSLIDELRQSDLADESVQKDLDAVDQELERWHQKTEGIPPAP